MGDELASFLNEIAALTAPPAASAPGNCTDLGSSATLAAPVVSASASSSSAAVDAAALALAEDRAANPKPRTLAPRVITRAPVRAPPLSAPLPGSSSLSSGTGLGVASAAPPRNLYGHDFGAESAGAGAGVGRGVASAGTAGSGRLPGIAGPVGGGGGQSAGGGFIAGGAHAASAVGGASAAAQTNDAKRPLKRSAAGETWVDPTLDAWPENDFRLFVGNFGPEVSEEMLAAPFRRFASFTKCRVVHPKIGHGKIRPYGFLSFLEPMDALAVLKTMQGAYIGTRPITIQKSNWIERNLDTVRAHEREEKKARK